jgi:ectoine hydroxylase-related dioxygenase (phytanoyl-CoA dioxygenase family)
VQVGWHNDAAYWQMCTSDSMVTAWIALDDVEPSMGPVTMLDESNRWDETDPAVARIRRAKSFISADVAGLEQQLRSTGQILRKVPLCLRRGEVSFHHMRTFHGSGINLGPHPRVGLIVHLQDGANRHRRAYDADGEPYVHSLDAMVRRTPDGEPDYSDPRYCPVVWRAGG